MVSLPNWSVPTLYSTLSICVYQRVSKAQSRVSAHSCQNPPGLPASVSLANYADFPPGSLPHSHLQFPFLLADKTVLLIFCASECAREIRLYLAHLCTAVVSQVCSFHGPQWPKQGQLILITFQIWKKVLLRPSPCPTLVHSSNVHSDFHRAMPPTGVPLIAQVSIALLPSHMARPLATAHESIKSQISGLLPLFNFLITAGKTSCNSAHWDDLFYLLLWASWPSKQDVFHSPWNYCLQSQQPFVGQSRIVYRALSKWQ